VDEDEPAESLAALVEQELRQRRFERAVRLEYGPERSDVQLPMLLHKLHLTDVDAYHMRAELDFTDLMPIASLNRPELHDRPWTPMTPPALAGDDCDIFAVIRGGDLLVHHPYESFDASVGRFIRQAAEDPRVLALKMTVYRVGTDTHFLDALVRAAEAGKQVVCLVEVTARFDEQQNLHLAHALEKAGVHVVYGVVGLKTHCKTTLVVRQDEDGLRCYAHICTGNYNMRTARPLTLGTPSRSVHRPRTMRSISTPAREARRSASQMAGSWSWFILPTIRPGRPARQCSASRAINSRKRSRMFTGATSSLA